MAVGQQTADEIYALICHAIIKKSAVTAAYRGYIREMCPHVIGKKNGRSQALLYQFAGGSDSGLKPDGSPANWRCIRIEELSEVSIRKSEDVWHTASNYSAKQTCIDEIDVKVEA